MGAALSNLKYIAEACSAGERILEIINQVPKIDSDNMEGIVLDNLSSEVVFNNVKFAYPSRPNSIILKPILSNYTRRKDCCIGGLKWLRKIHSVITAAKIL